MNPTAVVADKRLWKLVPWTGPSGRPTRAGDRCLSAYASAIWLLMVDNRRAVPTACVPSDWLTVSASSQCMALTLSLSFALKRSLLSQSIWDKEPSREKVLNAVVVAADRQTIRLTGEHPQDEVPSCRAYTYGHRWCFALTAGELIRSIGSSNRGACRLQTLMRIREMSSCEFSTRRAYANGKPQGRVANEPNSWMMVSSVKIRQSVFRVIPQRSRERKCGCVRRVSPTITARHACSIDR